MQSVRLLVAGLASAALLVPAMADAQPAEGGGLVLPDEWVVLSQGDNGGLTSPLRAPSVDPLDVAPVPDVARAPDGTQVAWVGAEGVVVSDVWGGGRRVVRSFAAGEADHAGPVDFTANSSAVVFTVGDALERVDLATGARRVVGVDGRLDVPTEQGGPIRPLAIRALPTGDVVVDLMCWAESCGGDERPLVWRRDTGEFLTLPSTHVTPDGRRVVAVERVDGTPRLQVAPVRNPSDVTSLAALEGHPYALRDSGLDPSSELVALTYGDGRVEVRSLDDGSVVAQDQAPTGAHFLLSDYGYPAKDWSPDGGRLALTAVWTDPFRSQPWVLDVATGQAARAVSRDGLGVAGWDDHGRLLVEDGETYRVEEGGRLLKVAKGSLDDTEPPLRPVVGPVGRYAGEDRVATAVALSRAAFASAGTVVVARSDLYPDALSGSALAGTAGGPVLLTASDGLDARVAQEVRRLDASTAYILGTPDVMSRQVADDLRAAGVDRVVRLGGQDRFDTAALVADEVSAGDGHAFLVEGADVSPSRGWPDAVAVAGRAASTGTPVLLSFTDRLPDATREAISALGVDRVTIVGGPVAISDQVEREIRAMGVSVERVAGDTRYDTSVAVARLDGAARLPVLVTGQNWPDALAAGPAAAQVGGTVLLTPQSSITSSEAVEAYLQQQADTIERAAVAGSTGVVDQRIVRELVAVLDR